MSSATLITLVGPSGAGKTTLARALQAVGFGRIATTTTRSARSDEVVGRDLHVVSPQRFNQLRSSNSLLAVCDDYSSASYGVQVQHLRAAAATALPQIIIVEPSGIAALESWAAEAGMPFAAVFVTSSVAAVRSRLEARYAHEAERRDERQDRLARALREAEEWRQVYAWDLVADSGNTQQDVEAVLELTTRPSEPTDTFAACA